MANLKPKDIPLDTFQNATKVFDIPVKDADGNPVDLTGVVGRFVVHDENTPTASIFATTAVALIGAPPTTARVTVVKADTLVANRNLIWKLWDSATDRMLARGPFQINPAASNHP